MRGRDIITYIIDDPTVLFIINIIILVLDRFITKFNHIIIERCLIVKFQILMTKSIDEVMI